MRALKSNQGFTLVELMVSLVVAGVVLAGSCSTFYSQHTSYLNQEQIVSMQQNLRVAMYIMERDIRMAGHDPNGDSGAGIVTANAAGIRIAQDLTNNAGTGIPDGDVGEPGDVEWSDEGLDLVLTTGGTGFSPRDWTPEATKAVIERETPGIAEAMRRAGSERTPTAILSRAAAGIRKSTLIVNLPGSEKAVRESLGAVLPALPHGIEVLRGEASECAKPHGG